MTQVSYDKSAVASLTELLNTEPVKGKLNAARDSEEESKRKAEAQAVEDKTWPERSRSAIYKFLYDITKDKNLLSMVEAYRRPLTIVRAVGIVRKAESDSPEEKGVVYLLLPDAGLSQAYIEKDTTKEPAYIGTDISIATENYLSFMMGRPKVDEIVADMERQLSQNVERYVRSARSELDGLGIEVIGPD